MREIKGANFGSVWPPVGSPMNLQREEDQWRSHFDNSVNAVSFGFVATAILISMFLVMAIFERFLRPPGSDASQGRLSGDSESRLAIEGAKLGYQSPKMAVYSNGVSVLMPGDDIPSFIACLAPVHCHSVNQVPLGSSPESIRSSNSNSIQES